MKEENVILVNQKDQVQGSMEKIKAHREAAMHRAFSIFVFNNEAKLMLHQRALTKYHSPGLWTNTCCSHPRPGEKNINAAHRRLVEEMGFDTELSEIFSFSYKSDVGQGLTENEYDHVFLGEYNKAPKINPEEVADYKFMSIMEIEEDMRRDPTQYTVWFRIAFDELKKYLQQNKKEWLK